MCAYVDDVNMITGSRDHLVRVVAFVKEFADHFTLSLSQAKTKLWASDTAAHEQLHGDLGFGVDKSFCALGGEWPTNRGAKPKYDREHARLDECVKRLVRARTLPIPAPKLALILSAGCLSLIDSVNLPDPKPYMRLRPMVKEAFGLKAGAPEVVMSLFMNSTLDPQMRWLLAILRLWHHVLQRGLEKDEVDEVIEQARGRLGIGAVTAFRWGITVSNEGFWVGPRWVPLREDWFVIRKVITRHLKMESARRLAERRPAIFGGLEGWNHKQHNKLLLSVSPCERMALMKLWTGSSMCQHKRSQIYGEEATCACGAPGQSIRHLLWECACFPPPSISIEFRRHLPNAQSVAHLLPPMATSSKVRTWRESCMRAVRILSKNPSAHAAVPAPIDQRGHDVTVNPTGSYVFCKKCFVTRRIRDKKWIWIKRCKCEDDVPRSLGERWQSQGHEVVRA